MTTAVTTAAPEKRKFTFPTAYTILALLIVVVAVLTFIIPAGRYDLDADAPTGLIDTAGLVLTRQRRFMPRGEGEPDNGRYDSEIEVFGVDGAALVARRTALEATAFENEYLDENFITHKEDHDISWRLRLAGWECWYVPSAVAYHARTTRGLGSTSYLSAIRSFYRNEQQKSQRVQVNAMKNQWLMLMKYEDGYNFVRDLPFILTRELTIAFHHLLFAPRSLAAIPKTLKLLSQTLRRRRAVKRSQVMDPRELRRWLAVGQAPHRPSATGPSGMRHSEVEAPG